MKATSLALCLACAGISHGQSGTKLDLRVSWQAQAEYVQHMTWKQKVGIPLHGHADAETHLKLHLKPKSMKVGELVAIKVQDFKTKVDMPFPMKDAAWDSAQPAEGNQDIQAFFTQLQALPLAARTDARGQTTELQGMEKFTLENAILSRFLGKEQLSYLLKQNWFMSLPSKPVGVGDSWPYQVKFPTPMGQFGLSGHYTVQGEENLGGRRCWKIQLQGRMSAQIENPTKTGKEDTETQEALDKLAAMGLKLAHASMSGTLFYDAAAQQLRQSEIDTDLRIGVAKYPSTERPAEIPIQQKVMLTLEKQ
jgi:hypothetical protein